MSGSSIFDDIFRTMVQKLPRLMIPLINEAFGETCGEEEELLQLRNEHCEVFGKVITDSILMTGGKTYHIECQSTDDATMAIRMVEYDFSIALEQAVKNRRTYELKFPETCVLYLRSTPSTPETLEVKLSFPSGECVTYRARTMKLCDYKSEDIFAKRLFCLLPFYILKYERQKEEIAGDPERLGELLKEYGEIRKQLEEAFLDEEHSGIYADLVDLIGRIADYVFEKEEEVRKGVGEVMGGKILKLRSEILREEGWESGRKSGLEEGRKFGLVEGHKSGLEEGRKSGLEEGRKFGLVEGHKSGLEEGRKSGLEEGRESGREEGREEALRIFIEDKIEDGCSEETIISKLVRHYHFSPEEAKARYRSCSLQSV